MKGLVRMHNYNVINHLNLFARVTGKKVMSKLPEIISFSDNSSFDKEISEVDQLAKEAYESMEQFDFTEACEKIWKIVLNGNNKLLSGHQFWNLVNGDAEQVRKLEDLVYLAFEITRISSLLMLPICPELARSQLACVDASEQATGAIKPWLRIDRQRKIKAQLHLFKRMQRVQQEEQQNDEI
jgi:methionyl-tRNA synthetase